MRPMPPAMFLALAVASTEPLAQGGANTAPTPTGPFGSLSAPAAQPGPFPPRPDNEPSIHRDPEPAPAPAAPAAQGASPGGVNAPPAGAVTTTNAAAQAGAEPAVRRPTALELAQWAEEQLDRAELDNARNLELALQAPPPMAGFTGLTSERDR